MYGLYCARRQQRTPKFRIQKVAFNFRMITFGSGKDILFCFFNILSQLKHEIQFKKFPFFYGGPHRFMDV
jgi:hypothetical protein